MEQLRQVWVAYATPEQQFHIAVDFSDGMTAMDAIDKSEIAHMVALPEPLQLGIFGVKVETTAPLHAGDRVEIYRALTINPKDIRRKRAAQNPVGRFIKGNRFKQSS
ncbi:RnfH family protein [Acinetobacter haemolyticus]|uniref:RnfH family protein n=1 Tax=Acinetobacter haemolyticus TaxID=29430 RepID=UPI000D6906E4|nr:RnfH family protein [Acinetobacter haemolyticus]